MSGSFTPAGGSTLALGAAIQLYAGEAPITTNRAAGGAAVELAQYTVIAFWSMASHRYWSPTRGVSRSSSCRRPCFFATNVHCSSHSR